MDMISFTIVEMTVEMTLMPLTDGLGSNYDRVTSKNIKKATFCLEFTIKMSKKILNSMNYFRYRCIIPPFLYCHKVFQRINYKCAYS